MSHQPQSVQKIFVPYEKTAAGKGAAAGMLCPSTGEGIFHRKFPLAASAEREAIRLFADGAVREQKMLPVLPCGKSADPPQGKRDFRTSAAVDAFDALSIRDDPQRAVHYMDCRAFGDSALIVPKPFPVVVPQHGGAVDLRGTGGINLFVVISAQDAVVGRNTAATRRAAEEEEAVQRAALIRYMRVFMLFFFPDTRKRLAAVAAD